MERVREITAMKPVLRTMEEWRILISLSISEISVRPASSGRTKDDESMSCQLVKGSSSDRRKRSRRARVSY